MTPSPLDAPALTAALAGSCWQRVDVVAETGSTNADLLARAAGGEDIAGTVLLAENQLAGRGRNGRSWSAVPGTQILMSVGVPTAGVPGAAWGWLPLATGLAVLDALARHSTVRAGLKWPNDVLVDGCKLAGILAEVTVGPADPVVIVGVGLNVSQRADELPDSAAATSLAVLGSAPDRAELVVALLRELDRRLAQWRAGPAAALLADYRAASVTVGSRVRALQPGDRQVIGDAVAVDDQGRLVIDTEDGPVAVSAGDIVHLRPL
jgi:BirA family biotin operon repressor/biotin-[acetyl-CoA-carboxylase] ligase